MMASELIQRPFIKNPFLSNIISIFDLLRDGKNNFNEASCLLLTGESGSGKSELAKYYLKANPPKRDSERLHSPVIHFELKSISTPEEFLRSLLIAVGDPQLGRGAKNKNELFDRLIVLLATVGCELLILDEIQVIMERRSASVVTGLADLFKDLIKYSHVPTVFMGMPWSKYLIDSNNQLCGRISYRYMMPPYRISTAGFRRDYRALLKMLGDSYGISRQISLEDSQLTLRFFCFSSGNLRATTSLVNHAYIQSKRSGENININSFVDVVRNYGVSDDLNPFLVPIEKLTLRELVAHSDWNFGYRANKNAIIQPEYATFGVTAHQKIYSVLGAA